MSEYIGFIINVINIKEDRGKEFVGGRDYKKRWKYIIINYKVELYFYFRFINFMNFNEWFII